MSAMDFGFIITANYVYLFQVLSGDEQSYEYIGKTLKDKCQTNLESHPKQSHCSTQTISR